MLLKRFFDKRRQDKAGQAAKQAKPSLKRKDDESLKEQALRHADPSRRLAAVRDLSDVAALGQILTNDADEHVRTSAAARLRELLCDPSCDEAPAPSTLEVLLQGSEPALLQELALRGQSPETRRAAIELVQDQALLARCAVEDRTAANRNLAVERIDEKPALEDVLREIGKRDKNVHRAAREKLRAILDREERPRIVMAQCEDICAKLERLGRLGNWTQDRALLEHLERQWAELRAEAEPELELRFRTERTRFLEAYAAHCEENASQLAQQAAEQEAQRQAEALLSELEGLPDDLPESDLQAEYARIAETWSKLPPLPKAQGPTLERRYAALTRTAAAASRARADQCAQTERLSGTLAKIERMLADSRVMDGKRARRLLDEGRALAETLAGSEAAKAFQDAAERLEARVAHQRKQAERKLQQFAERIEELETHLNEGELKKADPLFQSLQSGLELAQASGSGPNEVARFTRRLRSLAPRLRELQNWRRWGADQHREGLCAAMEELIDKELPLEVLAEQLRTLQQDWKSLDKSGSPANHGLWERFHTASERVYARCRPFMEAQTAEREANRVARERTCEQLERFLASVDWERVEWKKILRAEREMRQTWAAIGPTEGRHRKQLERRFHQSLRQLSQRLDAERKLNQAHKRSLVEQVESLIELPDLDAAIERTKGLQRAWHTTVPARQKDENKLWQSFRAACDAVFERRAMAHQAHVDELKANLETREAICKEALEVAANEQDPKRLAAARRELTERWQAAEGLPVPRQVAGDLARSWRNSLGALEQQRRAGEERRRLASLELLQSQSDICQKLELSVLDASDPLTVLSALRTEWSGLDRHEDTALQTAMQRRFDQAAAAAESPAERSALQARLMANAEHLRHLCLRLEIAAGVESPPDLAQERLELQVARLSERMTEGEDDPLQGATELLHDWYRCGLVPEDAALSRRFDLARQALIRSDPRAIERHA